MEPLQREPLGAQEVQAACESVTADGINALSNFVDSRVQWVMPDKWIWIPGVYEFESTEVLSGIRREENSEATELSLFGELPFLPIYMCGS